MEKATRYKLEVNLTIVKEEWNGPIDSSGKPKSVNGDGYWGNSLNNERLTVNETMQLGSMNFMELMEVLSQLHDSVKMVQR